MVFRGQLSCCLLIFVLLLIGRSLSALEVERNYEHYIITPTTVKEIFTEMEEKGPYLDSLKKRARAVYRWSPRFLDQLSYKTLDNGECEVIFNEPKVIGTIQLYLLKKDEVYTIPIINAYEYLYETSHQHELEHELIVKEGLEKAERRMHYYISISSENCIDIKSSLEKIYQEEYKTVLKKNEFFDCQEYGFEQRMEFCEDLSID